MTLSTRRLSLLLLLLIVLGGLTAAAMAWRIGGQLYAPNNYRVGPPPAGLGAEAVDFPSRSVPSCTRLAAARLGIPPGRGGADARLRHHRRSMLERARFLRRPVIRCCCSIFNPMKA